MKKAAFLFLLVGFLQIQCESDSETCFIPATIRDLTGFDGCGFVFELDDGSRIEPIKSFCKTPPQEEDPLDGFVFVDGKKVRISYIETGSPSICMVGPVVKITCITELNSTSSE